MKVPIFHIPANTDYLSLLITVILVGVNYFTVVLICMYVMTSDAQHLFICLLAMCIYSLVKCTNLLNWVIRFLTEFWEFFNVLQWVLYLIYILQTFSVGCPHSLNSVFQRAQVVNFVFCLFVCFLSCEFWCRLIYQLLISDHTFSVEILA